MVVVGAEASDPGNNPAVPSEASSWAVVAAYRNRIHTFDQEEEIHRNNFDNLDQIANRHTASPHPYFGVELHQMVVYFLEEWELENRRNLYKSEKILKAERIRES